VNSTYSGWKHELRTLFKEFKFRGWDFEDFSSALEGYCKKDYRLSGYRVQKSTKVVADFKKWYKLEYDTVYIPRLTRYPNWMVANNRKRNPVSLGVVVPGSHGILQKLINSCLL